MGSHGGLSFAATDFLHKVAARAEQDKNRLSAAYRAYGFYDAEIVPAQRTPHANLGPSPGSVSQLTEWRAVAGQLYKVGWVELHGIGELGLPKQTQENIADVMNRLAGLPAQAIALDAMEDEIRWYLQRASYPFASVTSRSVVPDKLSATVSVRIAFNAGQQTRFGEVSFKGLRRVLKARLTDEITFKSGDYFDPLKLKEFEQNLERLAVFQDVRVTYADSEDANGRLPVEVQVREYAITKEEIGETAFKGMFATLLCLGLLSVNVIASAGGAARRFTWPVALMCLIALAFSAVFALERVNSLLSTF